MKNILEDICQLLHRRKYKEAENLLLDLIEKTLTSNKSSDIEYINNKKEILLTIYRSFNEYYLHWLKKNKINIKKEKQLFKYNYHTNFLIAKSSKAPEMEDLLFELENYLNNLNSKEQKKEVKYHLHCYKNGRLKGASYVLQ